MRTLKKTLCLVLVLAMALSFCTVAFAAKNLGDYVDAADAVRPYEEAVDTLVGVGLIAGVSDTELGLNEYVTREQAAKMIAYALVGAKAADAVSKQAVIFSDVEAGRWSAGYIGLCNTLGIINGYSKDVFGPEDNVTGYQFAKMLLGMVGYGKNSEYTGEAWAVNAARDAVAKDIFDGILDSATDAAITRKEAFAMLFNAMTKCVTVDYNAPFDAYYTAGESVVDGVMDITESGANKYTLGYINFGLEKVDAEGGEDNYGRPAHYWTVDDAAITNTFADAPTYTFTGKVTYDKFYDTVGKTVCNYADNGSVEGDEVQYIVDGYVEYDLDLRNANGDTAHTVAGESSVTEVYVDKAAKTLKIVVINNYFGKVSDIDVNNDDKLVATITGYGALEGKTLTKETDKFEKNDYVVFTGYYNQYATAFTVDTVALADKTAATEVTAVANTYIKTADAKLVKAGKLYVSDTTIDAKDKYDLYTDNFGNLIGAVLYSDAAASLNYLYVVDVDAAEYGAAKGNAYVKVAADFTDGTSDVINLYIKNANKTTAQFKMGDNWYDVADFASYVTEGSFYAYTVNADGLYTLRAITDSAINAKVKAVDLIDYAEKSAKIELGSTNYETATSKTKLTIVEDQVIYTGYKNFAKAADLKLASGYKVLYTLDNNGKLVNIWCFGKSDVLSSTTFAVFSKEIENDGDYTYYELFVNGALGEYKFDNAADLASGLQVKGTVFTLKTDNKGISTGTKIEDDSQMSTKEYWQTTNTVASADADGYYITVVADRDNYIYYGDKNSTCQIYDIESGNAANWKAIDSVEAYDEVTVVCKQDTGADDQWTAVVILVTGEADD